MKRWRHFVQNVGSKNAFKTVFVALIALAMAVLGPEKPYSVLVFAIAAALPALARHRMAQSPEFWSEAIRYGGLTLLGLAFLAGMVKDKVETIPGNLSILIAMMTLYVSAFFWLSSDHRVLREDF